MVSMGKLLALLKPIVVASQSQSFSFQSSCEQGAGPWIVIS